MKEVLRKALKWWDEEAKYITTGDYGEHNLFDEEPEWVINARKLLGKEE